MISEAGVRWSPLFVVCAATAEAHLMRCRRETDGRTDGERDGDRDGDGHKDRDGDGQTQRHRQTQTQT